MKEVLQEEQVLLAEQERQLEMLQVKQELSTELRVNPVWQAKQVPVKLEQLF
jgi:hypothetical protein